LRRQSRREHPDAEWGQVGESIRGSARSGWTTVTGWWGRRGAAAPPATSGPSSVEALERLTELHRSGALSDEEYGAAKAEVLGLATRSS
jgi:hypothetical protein